MAEARDNGWKLTDLPEYWQRRLTERGITEQDWQDFTDPRFQVEVPGGGTIVQPHYWFQMTDIDPVRAQRIVTTMLGFIEEGAEAGVPTRSVLGDAVLTAGSRPGTPLGEFTRSSKQFKSFAINTLLTQYGQLIEQPRGMSRAQYLAMFAVWFGFLGAASLQLKELVNYGNASWWSGGEPLPDRAPDLGAALGQ
jgi:hypothetical protein